MKDRTTVPGLTCSRVMLTLALLLQTFFLGSNQAFATAPLEQAPADSAAKMQAAINTAVAAAVKAQRSPVTPAPLVQPTQQPQVALEQEAPASLDMFQKFVVLSPLLLHLLLLLWINRSKMSLKEALDDKETLNKEEDRQQALRNEVAATVFNNPLSSVRALPAMPGGAMPAGTPPQAALDADVRMRAQVVDNIFPAAVAAPAAPPAGGVPGGAAPRNAALAGSSATTPPPTITSVSRLIVFISGYAGVAIGTCLSSFMIYRGLAYPGMGLPDLDGLLTLMLSLGIGVVPYAVNRIAAGIEAPKT